MRAAADESGTVLQILARTPRPWLLIYDNADDLEALNGLLPPEGTGHFIVTSRRSADAATQIRRFRVADGAHLLRKQLISLSDAQAEAVAAAVDNLPIALRLATDLIRSSTTMLQAQG